MAFLMISMGLVEVSVDLFGRRALSSRWRGVSSIDGLVSSSSVLVDK